MARPRDYRNPPHDPRAMPHQTPSQPRHTNISTVAHNLWEAPRDDRPTAHTTGRMGQLCPHPRRRRTPPDPHRRRLRWGAVVVLHLPEDQRRQQHRPRLQAPRRDLDQPRRRRHPRRTPRTRRRSDRCMNVQRPAGQTPAEGELMAGDLVDRRTGELLAIPDATISTTALVLADGMTFDEWADLGGQLATI